MPIIQILVSGEADANLTRSVQASVVDITTRVLRKKPELTAVVVQYVPSSQWFAGGPSLEEQRVRSYYLDIKVVHATNSKDEKARYLAEIHAAMGKLLGGVHEESYAYVDEVSADAYGFGGLTQEYRYIRAQI
jgi:4-oxalocrotonate tautomerase